MLKYENTSTALKERVYKIQRPKKYLHEIKVNLYKT